MIYLMSDNNYIKIGYTTNLKKRLKSLATGNANIKLLSMKAGSEKDEDILHSLCKEWHVKGEWFENNQQVIDIFEKYDPFSDEEFDLLKNCVESASSEEDYNINYNQYYYFKNKLYGAKDIPLRFFEYFNYLTDLYKYNETLSCIKSCLKSKLDNFQLYYKVNSTTTLNFPNKLFDSKIEDSNKLIKGLEALITFKKEIIEDSKIVKNSFSRWSLEDLVKEIQKDIDDAEHDIDKTHDFLHVAIDKVHDLMKDKKEEI